MKWRQWMGVVTLFAIKWLALLSTIGGVDTRPW